MDSVSFFVCFLLPLLHVVIWLFLFFVFFVVTLHVLVLLIPMVPVWLINRKKISKKNPGRLPLKKWHPHKQHYSLLTTSQQWKHLYWIPQNTHRSRSRHCIVQQFCGPDAINISERYQQETIWQSTPHWTFWPLSRFTLFSGLHIQSPEKIIQGLLGRRTMADRTTAKGPVTPSTNPINATKRHLRTKWLFSFRCFCHAPAPVFFLYELGCSAMVVKSIGFSTESVVTASVR